MVDPSHRFLLPIEWRPKGAPTQFHILLWPVEAPEFLLALPPERWEIFLQRFEDLSLSPEDSAEAERLVGSSAFPCSLDQFGRLPLPEQAASAVGITDAALLIGRINKFEIWNPAKRKMALDKPDTKQISQTLKQIRI